MKYEKLRIWFSDDKLWINLAWFIDAMNSLLK